MGILRTNEISGLETPTSVTGSVSFDGDGDYLSIPSSGDFAYGTGDFTWEVWVYVNSFSGNRYVLDHDSNGGTISNGGGGNTKLHYYNATIGTGSVLYTTGFGTNLSTNTWYHLAAVRKNGTTSLYTNGVLTASASDSHNYGAQVLNIGRYGAASSGYEFNGFISNLRILKGTALYTSNFTPPVNELQRIGDTVLLCCNNPDSAGAEATGKTITVNGNAAASTFSPGLTRDFTYGTQFSGVTKFDTQGYFVPPSGTTEQRGRGRGVFGGGVNPAVINQIEYIEIQSQGNSIDFGDLTQSRLALSASSSSTRGIFAGGEDPARVNIIDYVSIKNTSNSLDFGDLSVKRSDVSACSSNTRSLIAGGYDAPSPSNIIEYITIASLGNSQTFGILSAIKWGTASCSSPIRGVFAGGHTPSAINVIEYVTISALGNAIDFGDLTQTRYSAAGCSSSTRGIFGGGLLVPTQVNTIDYITISSIGNAIDFGDLIQPRQSLAGSSSSIRGVFGGGFSTTNTIDYITISSTGNAQDFGDLTVSKHYVSACSDSHGGLS
jgi:hypothetical protein